MERSEWLKKMQRNFVGAKQSGQIAALKGGDFFGLFRPDCV